MQNSWNQTLVVQQGPGAALANSTTQTSLLLGQAKFTMPAGFEQFIGNKFRIKAHGRMSTLSAAPGTLSFFVMFGVIAVVNGGASPTLATSQTNVTWDLELDLTVVSVGSGTAATVMGAGRLITAGLTALVQLLPATSPAAGSGFDSTTSFQVDLQAQWSVANASNSIQCTDYELISCN